MAGKGLSVQLSINIPKQELQIRREVWDAFFEKYENVGENSETCSFYELNHKMFLKSPDQEFKKNKIKKKGPKKRVYNGAHENPEAIDSDLCSNVNKENVKKVVKISDICDTTVSSTEQFTVRKSNDQNKSNGIHSVHNDIYELIHFIEEDLKSELKAKLTKRKVSELLELDDFSYWHNETKKEMRMLEKHISRDELKLYTRYCHFSNRPRNIDVYKIQDLIVHENSNLRDLLLKREYSRFDEKKHLKYRRKVFDEWHRLGEVIPVNYLLLYVSSIISAINKSKMPLRTSND